MRFLHLADLHLDAPFATRSPRVRNRLRAASREALRGAVELALREEVDALLVAGDLFDGEAVSFQTERLLLEEMTRLDQAGIQVVYATGNHDPEAGARGGQPLPWPGNVTVLDSAEPRTVEIRDRQDRPVGSVTGAGHSSRRVTTDLSAALSRPGANGTHVALLHTQVMGSRSAEEHHPYAPSVLARLQEAGFHYWALGHVHLRQELSPDPPIHYPGCLMGLDPTETGPKGGLLVDLSTPSAPAVEFRELAPVRWEVLDISDLEGAATLSDLLDTIRTAWEAAAQESSGAASPDCLLRILLSGPTPLWRELRSRESLEELEEMLLEDLGVLQAQVRASPRAPTPPPETFQDRQDVLGEALRLLRGLRAGDVPLPENWREDLLLGEVLGKDGEDEEGVREETLDSVLEGADRELVARMLARETP